MKKLLTLILLMPCFGFAQPFANALQRQLDQYYKSFMPLKVHVFTNQPEYAPGDTLFFKVNLVTAQGHRPVRGKSIMSAALLNTKGERILINGFSISDGYGNNQIILPTALAHGNYYLTLWNDWMIQNKSLDYKKLIRVGVPHDVKKSAKLSAAPEGGNLVAGLNTKVVAIGEPSTLVHVSENGNQILQFNIGTDGTGAFYLTPKKGSRYDIASADERFPLPEVKDDGIGILASPLPAKRATRVYVTAPEESIYRDKNLHLIVSMQGIIYQSTDIRFSNQAYFSIEIPMDKLPQGIAQITLLDEEKKVVVERLIYNPATQSITATVDLKTKKFKTRERIDLKLKIADGSGPVESKIALTAFNTSFMPMDTLKSGSILTDFYLSGDAGFDAVSFSEHENAETINNKLVLTRWSRFDWNNLAGRSDHEYYSQYMRFKGKAFDLETNKPVPDSTLVTFFMHKNVNTYQAYTNANGEFSLTMLFEFYGTDEVFYRVEHKGKSIPTARVNIAENRLVQQTQESNEKSTTAYHTLFDQRKIIHESFAYHTNASRSFVQPETESLIEEEIFGPDVIIRMEDFHLFPTMVETLREVIPFAQHRKIRGSDVVRVFNSDTDLYWENDPVYVIDGVMTDDTDYFLSLNPSEIATIKVVYTYDKLRTFGAIGNGGMFIVDTKIPDNYKNVQRSVRSLILTGLNEPLRPAIVTHKTNSRIPDLRTNLVWLTDIETNDAGEASIEFFASDVPGKYQVKGEGITSDGKFFSFQEEFEVVFGRNN